MKIELSDKDLSLVIDALLFMGSETCCFDWSTEHETAIAELLKSLAKHGVSGSRVHIVDLPADSTLVADLAKELNLCKIKKAAEI